MIRHARWLALLPLLAQPAAALTLDLPATAAKALDETEPLGSLALATGPWAEGVLPSRTVEGAVTREVWQVPGPGTTLGLLAPLRDQVAAQGYEILLDCEDEACGGFDFRSAIEVLPPPAMFADLADFHYLSAVKDDEALTLLVSRSDERGFVQLLRVAPAEPGTVPAAPAVSSEGPGTGTPPPGDFATRIEGEGRVVLEGLAFATGSSELASGGDAGLAALAAYLAENPTRRVALVGHTDAQGPLGANIALSKRRAQAVADRLASRYGVDRSQLQAEGMGWLSPRATNLTPEGREANRRVEAVILP
ncbi:Outer membrane protein A precursor [Rubellimicrobium mesophilum DSM 19309]|uniref:Outer membrane protein A n=1 Tax=Rubellimicrobium mesophilum DSM 19309 TaxID=442562 RepID=A0A017HUU3_9RHOB|nr:OmpA family protein [Rubellimicrobium mesophilum]EYD78151.1 Outer membrane protein A precursor [Rubellimicrobium mesophilum DSM 19309]